MRSSPSPDSDDSRSPRRRAPASAKSEQRIRDLLRVGRERLGISEATVFTYFRGKRELCVRVISDWYDEIIATMEAGLPREQPIRAQLHYLVQTHLRLFLVQGTGLCALVLSEGRSKGQALGESFLPLQRRYTAPLMDLLARGQASGELRRDVPLRLLRSMVLGPMEHLLWEVIAQNKPTDIDAVSTDLVALLWSALQAPDTELAALRLLRAELAEALARSGSGA